MDAGRGTVGRVSTDLEQRILESLRGRYRVTGELPNLALSASDLTAVNPSAQMRGAIAALIGRGDIVAVQQNLELPAAERARIFTTERLAGSWRRATHVSTRTGADRVRSVIHAAPGVVAAADVEYGLEQLALTHAHFTRPTTKDRSDAADVARSLSATGDPVRALHVMVAVPRTVPLDDLAHLVAAICADPASAPSGPRRPHRP